jgi:hypothetical protein
LTSEEYVELVKKDNNFKHFTASVGVANCSNRNYNRNYYELGNKMFLVCIVEFGKIEFVKLANEDEILSTLMIAPDRIMVEGEYRQYTSIERKTAVKDDTFKKFFLRSNKIKDLIKEIGKPNGDSHNYFYLYYKISVNRFVVCECNAGDKKVIGCYVADSNKKLYLIWEEDDTK